MFSFEEALQPLGVEDIRNACTEHPDFTNIYMPINGLLDTLEKMLPENPISGKKLVRFKTPLGVDIPAFLASQHDMHISAHGPDRGAMVWTTSDEGYTPASGQFRTGGFYMDIEDILDRHYGTPDNQNRNSNKVKAVVRALINEAVRRNLPILYVDHPDKQTDHEALRKIEKRDYAQESVMCCMPLEQKLQKAWTIFETDKDRYGTVENVSAAIKMQDTVMWDQMFEHFQGGEDITILWRNTDTAPVKTAYKRINGTWEIIDRDAALEFTAAMGDQNAPARQSEQNLRWVDRSLAATGSKEMAIQL